MNNNMVLNIDDFEISLGLDFKQRFGPSYNFLFNKESYKNEE